jgi:hypothetical protein
LTDDGETPYDLAVKYNVSESIDKLGKRLSSALDYNRT